MLYNLQQKKVQSSDTLVMQI